MKNSFFRIPMLDLLIPPYPPCMHSSMLVYVASSFLIHDYLMCVREAPMELLFPILSWNSTITIEEKKSARLFSKKILTNKSTSLYFPCSLSTGLYTVPMHYSWRDGRVVDCSSLENCRAARYPEFESLSLRHLKPKKKPQIWGFFFGFKLVTEISRTMNLITW